jgi:hypothetical protein
MYKYAVRRGVGAGLPGGQLLTEVLITARWAAIPG